jgi:hypothetical protein
VNEGLSNSGVVRRFASSFSPQRRQPARIAREIQGKRLVFVGGSGDQLGQAHGIEQAGRNPRRKW